MKLTSTIAIAVFSLGLFAVQVPASAASKSASSHASIQQVSAKKSNSAPVRAAVGARKRASEFFRRMASTPREFFQKRHGADESVRDRNEGIPAEVYVNVPHPVVSESSIF